MAIALHLGHDESDPGDWEPVRRHVSACAECRVHYRNLKSSLAVFEQVDSESTYEVQGTLWPEVKSRLRKLPGQRQEPKPLAWAPWVSFAIACVLFLAVWIVPPHQSGAVSTESHSERTLGSPFAQLLNQPQSRKERDIQEQSELEPLSEYRDRRRTY